MNPPDLMPADTIEKRRKQIEKAKAAHLSRQLQTRLQYARLKVDHGWQKQTLNEVENLYFHHYRARVSSRGSQKPEKNTAGTSKQGTSAHAAAPSSPSTAISTPMAKTRRTDQQRNSRPQNAPQAFAAVAGADEEESSAMEVDPPPDPDVPNPTLVEQSTSNVQIKQPIPHDTASPMMNSANPKPAVSRSPSPVKPPQPSLHPSPVTHARNPLSHPPVSQPQSPASSAAAIPPMPRNIPPTRQTSAPQPTTSSLRSRGLTTNAIRPSHSAPSSSLSGGSNAALTYDSFWSSHSNSSNYRASLTSIASYPNLNKGDTNLGIPNLATGYAFSMGAPSVPFQPLQKQPTLARKPSVPASLRQTFSGSTGST